MYRLRLLTLLILTFSTQLFATHINISLQKAQINGDQFLAVTFQHEKHWHTYWKNPGDAGVPPKLIFKQNNQQQLFKELEWPIPMKLKQSDNLLAYGYTGKNAIFFYLTPAQWQSIKKTPTTLEAKWLACADICVPESKIITFRLVNDKIKILTDSSEQKHHRFTSDDLHTIFNKIPVEREKPQNLEIYLTVDPGNKDLLLHYVFNDIQEVNLPHTLGLLTPFPHLPFSYHREKLYYQDNTLYGVTDIEWEGEFEEPPIKLPKNGVCKRPWKLKFLIQNPHDGSFSVITKTFTQFQVTGIETKKAYYQTLTPYVQTFRSEPTATPKQATTETTIWYFLLFAFLGGIILNFMPCVLPVISIKLFGLIGHSNKSHREILRHNLFYSLGIFLSFFTLAAAVHILKSTGEDVGWGFQLQSPIFVGIMIIVLFIFALNLFGLFEFKTPGGSKLGSMQIKDNYLGDVFSGVLATALSTPCSAPFLGTALTFAFTTSITTLYLIFFMIALGLAFPFIMTGIFPTTLKFLPRPGNWMNHLKYILGLTLLITTFWLIDILLALTSTIIFIPLATTLALIFFTIFIKDKNRKLFWISILLLIATSSFYPSIQNTTNTTQESSSHQGKLQWESWSPEKMQGRGKYVFVDFTAKWCLTCKANKIAVIDTIDFEKLVAKYNVDLILADWTKRDPIIGNWLKAHGFAGVPVYFVITPSGKLINLGETISINKIEQALKQP